MLTHGGGLGIIIYPDARCRSSTHFSAQRGIQLPRGIQWYSTTKGAIYLVGAFSSGFVSWGTTLWFAITFPKIANGVDLHLWTNPAGVSNPNHLWFHRGFTAPRWHCEIRRDPRSFPTGWERRRRWQLIWGDEHPLNIQKSHQDPYFNISTPDHP